MSEQLSRSAESQVSTDSFDRDPLFIELKSLTESFGLAVSDQVLEGCLEHLYLVLQANKTMNLTRILDLQDALILHILDSLTFLPYIHKSPNGAVLDMGTGGGFPGIPLALATDRCFTLLDSVGKKVKAVSSFIDVLGLSQRCSAAQERVEAFGTSHSARFAVVTARAMASLPVLVEYAAPILIPGGHLIVSKGNPENDEIISGDIAAKICGLSRIETSEFDLPRGLGHRTFLIYKKTSKPSIKLPRAVGVARKTPLA